MNKTIIFVILVSTVFAILFNGCIQEKIESQQNQEPLNQEFQTTECNNNQICETTETIENCTQDCPEKINPAKQNIKINAVNIFEPFDCNNNENSGKTLDVVFVPINFEDINEFSALVPEHIDVNGEFKGLFYYEPFKSNKNKFRFLKTNKLPKEIENNFINNYCLSANANNNSKCIYAIEIYLMENNCNYDKIIIIYNNEYGLGGGWAESINGTLAVTIAKEHDPFESQGHSETVHEFAHLLGLTDQKERTGEFEGYNYTVESAPNCDSTGCPKWCKNYIKIPSGEIYELCKDLNSTNCQNNVNCIWRPIIDEFYKTHCVPSNDGINIGIDCLEDLGCYYNCNGAGAWRPGNSIMFSLMNTPIFNAVEKKYLQNELNKYQ